MKKIVMAAIAAAFTVGLSAGAGAQTITIDLDALSDIPPGQLVGSFTNIAINNALIDGSVSVDTAGVVLESTAEAATSTGATASETAQSVAESTLGDVETLVLGASNTGDITLGVASTVDDALAGSASASSDYSGPLQNTVAANMAFNQADLDASVTLASNTASLAASGVSTTAIGAVNTGSIVAGVAGTLADMNVVVAP